MIKAEISFKSAEKDDLLLNSKTLRYGQCYLLLNADGKTLSGFHIIRKETDAKELAFFFKEGRVFVPVDSIDRKFVINND